MASVFLSYDHEDSVRAAPIAAALDANGHAVWWDRQIHGGAEYNNEIESAVESADAVVVLWSARSVRSAWVRDEAGEGRDRGRLVPVLIEPVKPPMGFRQYQTLDLSEWNGGKRIPRLPELLQSIERVAAPRASEPVTATTIMQPAPKGQRVLPGTVAPTVSRRTLLGGSAAAVAAVAGGGIWWATRPREDPRFDALMDQANDAIRLWKLDDHTLGLVAQAVAIQPNNAKALGMLAALRSIGAQSADPKDVPAIVEQSESEARRALSIDPREPYGLLAMFELQGSTLDWITRDQRLRQIIAIDGGNIGAIAELVLLTQATGMCRESWDWNERAIGLAPLNPDFLSKRALKLWILGRLPEADKVIDQVRALNPKEPWPWWVRFYLYAMTGRAAAAQAMLDGNPTMDGRPALAQMWRTSLPALDRPSPAALAKAREACINGARMSGQLASDGVQILAALGEIDAAFDVANGLLLSRGPVVQQAQPGSDESVAAAGWRIGTQWMFTPAAKAIRADPRFLPLCEGVGLTDYWRRRGVRPDYQRA
jgi:hypothetical protein